MTRPAGYALFAALCIAAALYVRREALQLGFAADDYAQLDMLDGHYPVARAAHDLFTFSDGTRAEGERLMRAGFYPWWADPQLKIAMFRPLASLDLALDRRWFGHDPFGYHVHSAIAWCALLGLCALFFRALCEPRTAGIALLLLVASGALAAPLWWICNRAAVYSTAGAVLALLAYRRWRSGGDARWAWCVSVAYTLALACGEYAYCMLGYLLAYELQHGRGARARARALAPVLLPASVFAAARALAHAGVSHSGVYVDPLGQPLEFARAIAARVPVLVGDLVFSLRADYWSASPPWLLEWFERGWIARDWLLDPAPWQRVQLAVGLAACALAAWLVRWAWVGPFAREGRWLALGSAFSLLTLVPSFPSSRLLLAPWLGFAPLLAAWISSALSRPRLRWLALALLGYALVLPVTLQRFEFWRAPAHGEQLRNAIARIDADVPDFARRELVLMSAFDGGSSAYVPATRRVLGLSAPLTCMCLSWVPTPYLLTRDSERAFSVRFGRATALLRTRAEQLFRGPSQPLRVGEVLDVGLFRATVLELRDGLPVHVRFEFDRPLGADSLLFMLPTAYGFERFELPSVGAERAVPAPVVPLVP